MTGELNDEQQDYDERTLLNRAILTKLIDDVLDRAKVEPGWGCCVVLVPGTRSGRNDV